MSQYVQRCVGPCNAVRGVTAFRVMPGGGRAETCRWCMDAEKDAQQAARKRTPLLKKLVAEETRLLVQLDSIRSGIAELRAVGVPE